MNNQQNTEFTKYGEEWKAEMKTNPKDFIVNICSEIAIEKQKEIDKLKLALEEIASPISFMENRLKNGETLNGVMAIELSKDHNYLKEIAKKALSYL